MRRFARVVGLAVWACAWAALAQYNKGTPIVIMDAGYRPAPYSSGVINTGDNTGWVYWDYLTQHLYVSDGGSWAKVVVDTDPAVLAANLCSSDAFGNVTCQDAGFQKETVVSLTAGSTNGGVAITDKGELQVNGDAGFAKNVSAAGINVSGNENIGGQLDAGGIYTPGQTISVLGLCLRADGTDCISDSSGVLNTGATQTLLGGLTKTNDISLVAASAGASPSIAVQGQSGITMQLAGGGATGPVNIPSVALASLPTCTASTFNTTNTGAGSLAQDATSGAFAYCNGTSWVKVYGSSDWSINVYDPVTLVGTTGNIYQVGPITNAATLRDITHVAPIAGGGTGTETIRLSTASGCGSAVLGTLSIACNGAAGAVTTGTVNSAAVAAASTLYVCITGACTTADIQGNISAHFTSP